jgi:hypothetical protein
MPCLRSSQPGAAPASRCVLNRRDDSVHLDRILETGRCAGALLQVARHPGVETSDISRHVSRLATIPLGHTLAALETCSARSRTSLRCSLRGKRRRLRPIPGKRCRIRHGPRARQRSPCQRRACFHSLSRRFGAGRRGSVLGDQRYRRRHPCLGPFRPHADGAAFPQGRTGRGEGVPITGGSGLLQYRLEPPHAPPRATRVVDSTSPTKPSAINCLRYSTVVIFLPAFRA